MKKWRPSSFATIKQVAGAVDEKRWVDVARHPIEGWWLNWLRVVVVKLAKIYRWTLYIV
jgi:hypothetical protein